MKVGKRVVDVGEALSPLGCPPWKENPRNKHKNKMARGSVSYASKTLIAANTTSVNGASLRLLWVQVVYLHRTVESELGKLEASVAV